MPARRNVGRRDIRRIVPRVLPVRISRLRRLSLRIPGGTGPAFCGGSNEIRGSPRLDSGHIADLKISVSPQARKEASMEQFVHQQTIAIFRRLLSTQTDNNEVRRERLLQLLANEEAKSFPSSQHDVSPGPALANAR
jgi:hypothetical protein